MRLYDTHCHLTWHAEEDPPADRIARAEAVGVERFLTVAVDLESARACREIARAIPSVQASVGIHPNDVPLADERAACFAELSQLAAQGDFVAIGETGLDHFREWRSPEDQIISLEVHLDLAQRLGLPLIFHCRNAAKPLLAALRDRQSSIHGVMHCFSEDADAAKDFLDLGLHISFAGNLTYPKSQALRDACAIVPADRLLVETDAPFLAPQPKRGKRNEPAYVTHTLECAAETRGCAAAELAEQTFANAVALFDTDPRDAGSF